MGAGDGKSRRGYEKGRETPLTERYVLAQYCGSSGKKRAGRLFVLRKKG